MQSRTLAVAWEMSIMLAPRERDARTDPDRPRRPRAAAHHVRGRGDAVVRGQPDVRGDLLLHDERVRVGPRAELPARRGAGGGVRGRVAGVGAGVAGARA